MAKRSRQINRAAEPDPFCLEVAKSDILLPDIFQEAEIDLHVEHPTGTVSPETLRAQWATFIGDLDEAGLTRLTDIVKASALRTQFEAAAAPAPAAGARRPLPEKAPALWAERTTGREVSPADFIRTHYGDWINNGLTRAVISSLDYPLYQAFSKWIARHPEDDFDPSARRTRTPYSDPAEAVSRIREQRRNAAARFRSTG